MIKSAPNFSQLLQDFKYLALKGNEPLGLRVLYKDHKVRQEYCLTGKEVGGVWLATLK